MANKRYREKFMFWLNLIDDQEFAISELISELKCERRFAGTIRDGIRLICDLRQGKVDVLFELFPWIKTRLLAEVHPLETVGERALREQLERIEQQLLQQGNIPMELPSPQSESSPKAMAVPQFEKPVYNDEDDLVIKKDSSATSAQNFINSMLTLQQ
jgi:hypothetical protein